MFAAIHGNLLQGLYTLPLGLFMGYVYSKYRTLLAPVLFHAAANLLSVTASELGYLNFMADSEPLAWGITVGAAVVVLGCLYVIHDKVWLRGIHRRIRSSFGWQVMSMPVNSPGTSPSV